MSAEKDCQAAVAGSQPSEKRLRITSEDESLHASDVGKGRPTQAAVLRDRVAAFRFRFDALSAWSGSGPAMGTWVAGEAAAFHILPQSECPTMDRIISPFILQQEPLAKQAELGVDALLQEIGAKDQSLFFMAMPLTMKEPLEYALGQRGWRLEPEADELHLSQAWVPATKSMSAADAPPLPEGYSLDSLAVEDANTADDSWHFRRQGTLAMIQRCIKLRPSAGVRDGIGKLVSFAVARHDGQIGCLGTLEPHRCRGLARAVVHRLLAEHPGLYELVEDRNAASQALCRKVGMEPAGPHIVFMRAQRFAQRSSQAEGLVTRSKIFCDGVLHNRSATILVTAAAAAQQLETYALVVISGSSASHHAQLLYRASLPFLVHQPACQASRSDRDAHL